MKAHVLQCFRDSNARAGSVLHPRCWATLSSTREVEALQVALAELADNGVVEIGGTVVRLTEKGQELIY